MLSWPTAPTWYDGTAIKGILPLDRARYGRLEREAECQRIDNALQNGVDPYEADLRMRMWAIRIGC